MFPITGISPTKRRKTKRNSCMNLAHGTTYLFCFTDHSYDIYFSFEKYKPDNQLVKALGKGFMVVAEC